MSWQLAAFVILGLALALGFAWYERSKPQARVLALVAALAALAVVGRIAFAPFPNVKPTTDIVFFAGYALGGLPGFATGAVAALVSNIFFGQGPWTPWQMAAWGGVGAAGGAIALLTRGRELSRWTLAAICFGAGLAFGAVMDVYQWSLAAEQTLGTYLAIAGSSLPYNLAHAIGNAVFCVLIGPAFVRALGRYRRRFEFSWPKPAGGSAAASVVLALVLVAGAGAALDPADASGASGAGAAASYLERAQNSDGGFGGARGQGSTQLFTGWSALGLAAHGRNPRDVRRSGKNVIEYVRTRAGSLDDIGELERTILVLGASGLSPRDFVGRDLVAELKRRAGGEGSYGNKTPLAAFAVMALRAAGEPASSGAVRAPARWMAAQQNDDGGFGAGRRGGSSDVDDTGAVLQALVAANRDGGQVEARAVAFLKRAQSVNGGFPQSAGGESNAQSTAWAVQGLIAAGRSPSSFRRSGGRDPLAYLRSLQQDDGSVRYSRTSTQTPVWVTAQALTALAGKPFPLARVKRRWRGRGERRRRGRRRGEGERRRQRREAGRRSGRERQRRHRRRNGRQAPRRRHDRTGVEHPAPARDRRARFGRGRPRLAARPGTAPARRSALRCAPGRAVVQSRRGCLTNASTRRSSTRTHRPRSLGSARRSASRRSPRTTTGRARSSMRSSPTRAAS